VQGTVTWTQGHVRATRDLTPSIRLFEIAPQGGAAAWSPGSHIDVGIMLEGRPTTRSYSLVGEPDATCYRIAVRRDPHGRGGSLAMWALEPGALITVSNPRNLFELSFGRPHYLLIAGGIGVTPIIGMAMTLAQRGESFRLLYAGRARAEMAFLPELFDRLGVRLNVFASDEGARMDLAAEIARLPQAAEAYVCGPLGLLDAVRRAWAEAGRTPASLRYETFASSGSHAPEPFWVRVPRHGVEIVVPENQTLLDALTAAGIEVMAECRRGECGLCALDVVELTGTLDHRDVFMSEDQKQAGTKMCACVSRAVGGGVVLDTAYRPD
jgi:vanillate O-demethylase ferredoxin subunit